MEIEWSVVKDYIPIIVVFISSILAYIIGKSSERNKKYITMSEESVSKLLSKMYIDVIEITNVKNYDIESMKNFINSCASNTELYKIYDDVLINEIFTLSNKSKANAIENDDFSKDFNKFSEKVEKLYWERYIVNTDSFNWFAATKTGNSWFSFTGNLFLKARKLSEYASIVLTMMTYIVVVSHFTNMGTKIFSSDVLVAMITILIAVLIIYFLLNGIWAFYDRNPKMKNKNNIKKYISPTT